MTGSGTAEEVTQKALGVEIRGPEFWREGIRSLEELLALYEKLLAAFECGDYTKGVARIRCTNPNCRTE